MPDAITLEALKAPYDESYFQAYRHDPKREQCYRAEAARIAAMKPQGGRIFDVGCGLGGFLAHVDGAMWEKYGVDISDVAIARAREQGITVKEFDEGYDYPESFFDVIVFRGTIQHLDTPFAAMKRCVALLKPGGLMAFLSTPNANSLYYKLFGTLPFLNPRLNFYVPSDLTLRDALTNFGLQVIQVRYPYLETPYARPLRDHVVFLLKCFGVRAHCPFWRSMMELYAVKPSS